MSDNSSLGILDVDKLCGNFEDTFSWTRNTLNEKREVLGKRRSLQLLHSPPKLLDLNGSVQEQLRPGIAERELDFLVDDDSRTSFTSTSEYSYGECAPLDSKYFRAGYTFDPTCLRSAEFSQSISSSNASVVASAQAVSSYKTASEDPSTQEAEPQRRRSASTVERSSSQTSESRRRISNSTLKDDQKSFRLHITDPAKLTAIPKIATASCLTKAAMPWTSTPNDTNKPEHRKSINRVIFCSDEISARSTSIGGGRSTTPTEGTLNASDSWHISGFSVDFLDEKEMKNSASSDSQVSFISGNEALKKIDDEEKNFEEENALQISVNHDFAHDPLEEPGFESTGDLQAITASKIFGRMSWGLGSELNRPSFGMVVSSPLRELDPAPAQDTNLQNSDIYNSSYSVPKVSRAPKQKLDRLRRSIRIKERGSSDALTNILQQDSVKEASVTVLSAPSATHFLESSREHQQQSEEIDLPGSPVFSEELARSNSQQSLCNGTSLPVSRVQSAASCHCSTASESSDRTPAGIIVPTTRIHQVTPFLWHQHSTDLQQNGTAHASRVAYHRIPSENFCPSELPPIVACLGERVETVLPMRNPFPHNLLVQKVLTKVLSNGNPYLQKGGDALLSWAQNQDVLLPHQTKDVPISFVAPPLGQLCLTIELQWTVVDSQASSSSFGKSVCMLNCNVILPRVTLEPEFLRMKYHYGSNTAETTSFALLNHTPAPITLNICILMSACEDPDWMEAEFFFCLDHLRHIPGNNSHKWLDVGSRPSLSVCLAAGTAGAPSRAQIPISLHRGQQHQLRQSNKTINDFGATVMVSHDCQAPRRLAALRIAMTPSKIPMSTASMISMPGATPKLEAPQVKCKKFIAFKATNMNSCNKEDICIKNVGSGVMLTAYVMEQESSPFQLESDQRNQQSVPEWSLNTKESITLTVCFRPSEKASYKGELRITASTLDDTTSTTRVLLYGYGGACKLSLHGTSKSGNVLPRPLTVVLFTEESGEPNLYFINDGSRPAFVSIPERANGVLKFSLHKFVVLPFSRRAVTVTRLSRHVDLNMVIFYGEELFRQALSTRLSSIKKPSLLHLLDATGTFQDQDLVNPESVYPTRWMAELGDLFYKQVCHFDIHFTSCAEDNLDSTAADTTTCSD